jgi:hypothetical protein
MNDEKRELLDWLKSWYAGIVPTDKIYDRPGEDAYNKLRALIEAPPPKHTQCENCLDDLEDVKPCPKCDGLGYIEIDEPGDRYATRIYCDQCQVGYDLLKHDEDKYWEHINSKIDRKEGK